MVDFRGMKFNAKKALYINFQNHASIFHKAILSKINGGGHGRCYVLPKSMCASTNIDLKKEDRYSGLIYQHALANILNVSQRFIKLLHQPTETNGLVGQFSNR